MTLPVQSYISMYLLIAWMFSSFVRVGFLEFHFPNISTMALLLIPDLTGFWKKFLVNAELESVLLSVTED